MLSLAEAAQLLKTLIRVFDLLKIFFLEKEKNTLFYMALITREILTSLEVLYTKLLRESVLFCKKDAFENT